MCIDFEKAFDSLSWNFLYKILSFIGCSKLFLLNGSNFSIQIQKLTFYYVDFCQKKFKLKEAVVREILSHLTFSYLAQKY